MTLRQFSPARGLWAAMLLVLAVGCATSHPQSTPAVSAAPPTDPAAPPAPLAATPAVHDGPPPATPAVHDAPPPATPAVHDASPPAPMTQNASTAVLAPQLMEQLHWLNLTHTQNQLTDPEYQRARTLTIAACLKQWISSQQVQTGSSQWLHDELDALTRMRDSGQITAAEYQLCRSSVLQRYLTALNQLAQ